MSLPKNLTDQTSPEGRSRLRSLVKTGVASGLYRTGVDRLIHSFSGIKNMPLVILYHRVVENLPANDNGTPGMMISRRTLEHHLDWIGRRYRFISLDELGEKLERGDKFEKPVAAITFDDGYSDVYHNAFPMLKQKGIPAGVFVVTDLVGTPRLQIHDKLYILLQYAFSVWCSPPFNLAPLLRVLGIWQPRMGSVNHVMKDPFTALRALLRVIPQAGLRCLIEALENEISLDESKLNSLYTLNWDMVSEMQRTGITIGSHSKTHALLANESQPKVMEELTDSRQTLEKRLGKPIRHIAYPDGRFDQNTLNAAAASGYRFGYTICQHRDSRHPLLTIPRHVLWENSCIDMDGRFSPAIMSCNVNGIFKLNHCEKNH
jgi:peptidoglycan/xylan/chitin deacetylase (PgdA/CDA1 family)